MLIFVKPITYVTAHFDFLSFNYVFLRQLAPFLQVVEVFIMPEKTVFAKKRE